MNLIDMKMPKRKSDLEAVKTDPENREEYPYGLQLRFEKEQIEKINSLKKIEAGAKVSITAVGNVTEVRVTNSLTNKKRHSVEIQINAINIDDKKSGRTAFREALEKEKGINSVN